jgi:outer membrane protein assembly factor BamB
LTRVTLGRIGLILTLSFLLAACGGTPPMTTWPGLAANDQLAYVAAHQYVYAVHVSGDNYSKEAWRFPLQADATIGNFSAAPAVGPDVVIAAAEGPANEYSGLVFGLSPDSGEKLWCLVLGSATVEKAAAYGCQAPADVGAARPKFLGLIDLSLTPREDDRVTEQVSLYGDTAYFGLNNGKVYAVDALTGKPKWAAPFQAKQAVWAAPVADPASGRVYVGSLDHNLYALDLSTGQLQWKQSLGAAIAAAPAISDGMIYVGTFGSQVLALNAQDGSKKWSAPTASWVWGTPVLADQTLYFADVSGNVYAVNASTGKELWSKKPGDAVRAAPVVTDKTVIVGDRAGKIYGLSRADGSGLWPTLPALKGQLIGSPALISDTILVAPLNGDNLLVGYSLEGAQKWAFSPTQGK